MIWLKNLDIFVFNDLQKTLWPKVGFKPMYYGAQDKDGNTQGAVAHTGIAVLLSI